MSKNMIKPHFNIAHIMPWNAIGGTELATLRIARAVKSENFKSIMFCPRGGNHGDGKVVSDLFLSEGFETASYQAVEFESNSLSTYLKATIDLTKELKRRKIDIVHCADIPAGNYGALASKLARLPLICHVRNRYHWLSRFERFWLLGVNRLICVSQNTKDEFGKLAKYGDHAAKRSGSVIYDGLDVPSLNNEEVECTKEEIKKEFGIDSSCKIVGMVARVSPQKDYKTLIKAASQVVSIYPNVRFLIIGPYSQAEQHRNHYIEVKRELAAHNLDEFFIFTDFRSDVPRLMKALDIFVLSTHFEGFPLVILEAMALAKPVVATAVDGIPEIVIEGETGLLHAHENHEELADKLLRLLQDVDYAGKLGLMGRAFMQRNFGQEQFSSSMVNLYRQIVKLDGSVSSNQTSSKKIDLNTVMED